MITAILLVPLLVCGQYPQHRRFLQPNLPGAGAGTLLPTFSFSLNLGPVCACTPVTDSIGHPLLFDGGSAFCTKGNETTGILPGDMVLCPANMPRVMPGGTGSGGSGLQAWESKANALTWSSDFRDDGGWPTKSWRDFNVTVWSDSCLAPDNTMTADLVLFPAEGGGSFSFLSHDACATDYDIRLAYMRAALADGGTPTADGGVVTAALNIGGNTEATCSFDSASYTRCRQFDTVAGDIGVFYTIISRGPVGAQYVCLWQADCQENANQSTDPWPPPIPTTSSAVTRAADVARFDPLLVPMRSNLVMSATLTNENGFGSTHSTLLEDGTGSGVTQNRMTRVGTTLQCETETGATDTLAYGSGMSSSADQLQCIYDGASTQFGCVNGVCGDAGINADVSATNRVAIGVQWSGNDWIFWANGVVKNVSITEKATKDIYLFGDSIVEGNTAGTNQQPQYIIHNALGNAVAITNSAVSGHTIDQCSADWFAQLNVLLDAGTTARSYMMLQCGINTQPDAGAVISQLEFALATAQDAGVHVLASTITPQQTANTFISAVNSALSTFCTSRGITLANTFTPLSTGDAGALAGAYDYGDNVHLNDAGTYVETNVWIRAGGW